MPGEGQENMTRVESPIRGNDRQNVKLVNPDNPPLPVLPSLDHINPPKTPDSRMSRRKFINSVLAGGAAAAAVGAVDIATKGGISNPISKFITRIRESYNRPVDKPTATAEPSREILIPPIDREIVKIQRGTTTVNKFDTVNKDQIRLRRDATTAVSQGNDQTPKDNRVSWDNIKSINGVELGNSTSFAVIDAPLVEGQAADEAGQGYYWVKFENVELKNGEKTILYVSRSDKTKNIVQANGLPQNPQRDNAGKITEPNMGKIVIANNPK